MTFPTETHPPRIGIVSPSSPAAGLFPERFARGVEQLRGLGFEVSVAEHAIGVHGRVAATATERAADLNRQFGDPEVAAIIATIGGQHSCQVLPLLDWDLVRRNPKPLIGYSDITVLLHAIAQESRHVVFYGPTLMTEFAEYPAMPRFSAQSFTEALSAGRSSLRITHSPVLAAKGTDWSVGPVERPLLPAPGPIVARPGTADGVVLGGCVEAMERLRGTRYWPNFDGAILCMESAEDTYQPGFWEVLVADYANMNVWPRISGVAVGQKDWPISHLEEIGRLLVEATAKHPVPVLVGLPFGHISPIATLPIYAKGTLNTSDASLTVDPSRFAYSFAD
jgi:muramoyltetrapeptide carboxypeptidase